MYGYRLIPFKYVYCAYNILIVLILDTINKLGYSVILKYLQQVDLPLVPRYFTLNQHDQEKFEFDWVKADVNVKKVFAKDLFLEFTVDLDVFNRSINVMYLGRSRNLSPLPR